MTDTTGSRTRTGPPAGPADHPEELVGRQHDGNAYVGPQAQAFGRLAVGMCLGHLRRRASQHNPGRHPAGKRHPAPLGDLDVAAPVDEAHLLLAPGPVEDSEVGSLKAGDLGQGLQQ